MDFFTVPTITGTDESYASNDGLLRQGKKMWGRHVADVVIELRAALEPKKWFSGRQCEGTQRVISKIPGWRQPQCICRGLSFMGKN